jgi:hypothetical protein
LPVVLDASEHSAIAPSSMHPSLRGLTSALPHVCAALHGVGVGRREG